MPTLKAVCRETALSERWVRREAKDRSKGRGHSDDAECPTDPCLWCDALRWVLANADEVRRTHGAADRKARLQRAHERTVASVTWERDNADLWDFLDGMVTGGFKNAAVEAVEAGIVSEAMEDALRAAGVETSYEYGMSLSGDPKATLDLYYNARTSLSQEVMLAELQKLPYPPRIKESSPVKRTMRGRTVKEELDSAQKR